MAELVLTIRVLILSLGHCGSVLIGLIVGPRLVVVTAVFGQIPPGKLQILLPLSKDRIFFAGLVIGNVG